MYEIVAYMAKGRFPLPVTPMYTARVHGRPVPLPELTARVDGCQKMHPSSRAVNSARELGP